MLKSKKHLSSFIPFKKENFRQYRCAKLPDDDRLFMILAYGNLDTDGNFYEWRSDWNISREQCSTVKMVNSGDNRTKVYAPIHMVIKQGINLVWR